MVKWPHTPVSAPTVVALLAPALAEPGSVMVDATLGAGGHSEAILATCPNTRVIGIDRDEQALEIAKRRLGTQRVEYHHANYDELDRFSGDSVDAVLMDLGMSSMQIDQAERGFSYMVDGPLDMRMDTSGGETAAELLARIPVQELEKILRDGGETRAPRQVARAIVERRELRAIETSADLAEIVAEAMPAPARRRGGNPAKRTFQALRIAVNDELRILRNALPKATGMLRRGGRIVVEAYQSGEDRLVKQHFRRLVEPDLPADVPVRAEQVTSGYRYLTRGAQRASASEIALNSRAASVRIRALERRVA
ncbi:MAG: 16S rRNA (cytosine(1402)-N(4))-methyltransferase RsmH [Varibaculum sp.]|nr:16S rRNA (cytosine(1402)-N(4))-methyltransferase RsmH [Varibaculum sp.]